MDRQGVRLSNFHVGASCSPTRAMLLTERSRENYPVVI
ncbi:sulfatase-like hydrolase/transferase [Duganella sp. LX47W]|uniref:Sulfatase-like hydrolase/transferase n=2 Tax=Rugamonas apoptosis TaxID=2758570 RepID=A0A7W2FC02_9BURK|nr:sulfatase-like hydrolase/transferase [Rugamonas apoptosis]